jgi:hypothetical protein
MSQPPRLATPRRHAWRVLAALCGCVALAAAAVAQPQPLVERQYQLRFLSFGEGMTVATNECMIEGCRVTGAGPATLAVRADLPTHERIAKALRAADLPPADQAFQLILLEADRAAGGGDPGALPPAARKALADLANFLPYTSYRLLDAAFVRTNREARVVVEGMEGRAYEATLQFRGDPRAPDAELLMERFSLRLIPSDVIGLLMGTARAEAAAKPAAAPPPARAGGSSRVAGDSPSAGERNPTAAPAPQATPMPTLAENLLNTSFSLRRGETVVVGTSKLDGGSRALVVLLTALP